MGHKSLIEGFNAFLPKTHHIDPTVAETGVLPPHIIAAAMHSGIAAQLPPHPQMLGKMPPAQPQQQPQQQQQQQQHMPTQQTINLSHFVNQTNMPQTAWNMEQPPHPQGYYGPGPMASYAQPTRHEQPKANVAVAPPSATPVGGEQKKASPQFNKAFGYVKKIKTRFSNDPETYKAFLAALHSYHKEQMSIHEVYDQVSLLFRDNPDLLAEFMQFLPEQDASAIITKSSKHMEPSGGPALGRFGDIELKSKRAAAVNVSKAVKRARQATAMLSSYPSTAGYVATHRSPEENEFFDKVKAYLGSKSVYAEFLKCLNLFSQDILKLDDLLRLVNGFIGGNEELYGWFKRYIGLKETTTQAAVAPGEPSSSAAAQNNWKGTAAGITSEIPELNLNACKRIGSYRVYPKTHKLVKASGRTALCEEVLNDAMLSCPTFTSEDSTFVGSKKNQYEEALFKCEDERFELDLLIEYNLAAIAVFDPIVKRLDTMSPEDKASLQFGNNLGGTSEIIYRKAIRKIYGDKSEEIIGGLKRNPAVAMPIVLTRLKQKDEEWRRLQRDWNKVWREVHLKNYYKALDHQGIEFKAADKRNFALRTLISEMEGIHQEHSKQRERERLVGGPAAATSTIPLMGGSTAPTAGPTANHLEFTIRDTDRLLEDLVRLVKVYLRSTSGGGLTSADRKAVLEFFSTFVPEFFAWKRSQPTDSLVPSKNKDEEQQPKDEGSEDDEDDFDLPAATLQTATEPNSNRLLFANNSLFGFMRLIEMALERLDKLRVTAQSDVSGPFAKEKKNLVVTFLDLQTREKFPELGKDFYRSLLFLLKQLLYGDLEPAVFEEQTRFMFGNDAYAVYTFDKLIQTIVKQAQAVLVDPACEQLIRLFDSWKDVKSTKTPAGTKLSEYSLRLAAENLIAANPKDSLFRIEYLPKLGRMGFQMLDRLFEASSTSAEAKWSSYVDGFVKLDTNPAYLNPKSKVFLKRSLRSRSNLMDDEDGLVVDYNLECKICINTYKLFYVEHTEDSMVRLHSSSAASRMAINPAVQARFNRWWKNEWEVIGNGLAADAEDAFRSTFSLA